jgi:flagellar motor switch/type III secretory pathway protein FliN
MEQAAMGNVADLGAALQGAADGAGAPASGGAARNNSASSAVQSLDFILDIPLKVTVELGRSKMAVRTFEVCRRAT